MSAGTEELAGTWYSQAFSSAGRIGDRINTSTTTGVTLLPNGIVSSSSQPAVSGSTGDRGRRPGGSVTGLTDASLEAGRWARKGDPLAAAARPLRTLLRRQALNTVCEEARCPNLGECFCVEEVYRERGRR